MPWIGKHTEVIAKNEPWRMNIQLLLCEYDGEICAIPDKIVMRDIKPGELIPESALVELDRTAAQKLMDSLWNCGLRPAAGKGSEGQLAAVKYHLEDMRRLLFKEEIK